jgi:hypothetical protein
LSSAVTGQHTGVLEREVLVGSLHLPGNLTVPADAHALVLFAHGSGSSRLSPRNLAVATAGSAAISCHVTRARMTEVNDAV